MKCAALTIGVMVAFVGSALQAQTPPVKAGPEQQRLLGYFLGTWKLEGESKATPISKAGKLSGSETATWYQDVFLAVQGSMQGPSGALKYAVLTGWDPDRKIYQAVFVPSADMLGGPPKLVIAQASVSGSTWVTTWNAAAGGVNYHIRRTRVAVSPTSYTETDEYSSDNKTWVVYAVKKYVMQ